MQLPLLSFRINLISFFQIIPFLFFIEHVYYLRSLKPTQLDKQEVFGNRFHRNLFYALTTILPPLILLYLQVSFSRYQDLCLSSSHFILFFLDIALIFRFICSLDEVDLQEQTFLYKTIILWKYSKKFIFSPLYIFILLFSVYNYYLSFSIFRMDTNEKPVIHSLDKTFRIFHPILSYRSSDERSFLFPRLDLSNQNLLSNRKKSFSERSFKYANFNGSILDTQVLNRAGLQNASFEKVQWH